MKNRTKNKLLIISITLIIQLSFFYALDMYAKKIVSPSIVMGRPFTVNVNMQDIKKAGLSYNNKYLAFIQNRQLQIFNLLKKELVYSSSVPVNSVLTYKWLPDRNHLIFFSSEKDGLKLYSLEINHEEIKLKFNRSIENGINSIMDIQLSTYTNKFFLWIKDNHHNDEIIRFDIMKNWNKVPSQLDTIEQLAISNEQGILLLAGRPGGQSKHITVISNSGTENVVMTGEQYTLLGCSAERIYIGEINDNTLTKILGSGIYNPADFSVIWEGNIPYQHDMQAIADGKKITLLGKKSLISLIIPSGQYSLKKLAEEDYYVLSPQSDAVLQIRPQNQKAVLVWKPVS